MDILERQAKLEIDKLQGQASLFSNEQDNSLTSILRTKATLRKNWSEDRILGKVYKSIGYGRIGIDKVFWDLVMSRLEYIGSKLNNIDFLSVYKKKSICFF